MIQAILEALLGFAVVVAVVMFVLMAIAGFKE